MQEPHKQSLSEHSTRSVDEAVELNNIEAAGKEERQLEPQNAASADVSSNYLQGLRRHVVTLSATICLFLVNIEVSVVGTALIPIVEELNGVERMGWVVTGYLITYTATIIIWAKLSDIFGRKYTLATCLLIFTAFSGGCGAAQTMNQLIICRVFQGIGAAGMWSIALTIMYELVPRALWPIQGAIFAAAGAIGSLSGPIIGGGASQHGQWRWAFLFNAPAGAATLALLLAVVPANFPHQGDPAYRAPTIRERWSRHSLARLDGPGCFLILAATMLIVAVLLEGGTSIAWNSGTAIALFVVSGVLWILFMVNEWLFTKRDGTLEPIFPWRFLKNRAWMGVLLSSFISGLPYNTLIINIPQRFQELDGASPLTSAVRLIPFNLLISVFGALTNIFVKRTGVACIWMLLFGSVMQLAGLIWFAVLPEDGTLPATIYGCQILTGLGIGVILGITLLMTGLLVETRDIAVSSGALIQFRALGGVLGLSVTTTAFNNYLKEHLSHLLGNVSTSELLTKVQELGSLGPNERLEVRTVLSKAYGIQSKILVAFAALQILVVAMVYRKGNQVKLIEETPETKS